VSAEKEGRHSNDYFSFFYIQPYPIR